MENKDVLKTELNASEGTMFVSWVLGCFHGNFSGGQFYFDEYNFFVN